MLVLQAWKLARLALRRPLCCGVAWMGSEAVWLDRTYLSESANQFSCVVKGFLAFRPV